MLLSLFISERPGLCDIYFRIHSSWKKIKESPPVWRFSIDLYSSRISASTALNPCYCRNRHSTYIVLSSHVYACPLRRAVTFSRVLAGTWKLLNIQWTNKFIFGFFLFLISLNKVTRLGSFHPQSFVHAFIQQLFIEPLVNAILRTKNQWWTVLIFYWRDRP